MREIKEELGCKIKEVKYFNTYNDKIHDTFEDLELICYFGKLDGKMKLNPHDNINGYLWINKHYDKNLKLANLLKHKIIPNLINKELM